MRGEEFQIQITVPLDSVVPGERDPSEVILRVIIIL
jgi:hypothetical protein